jgi:hypothetical protein
MPDGFFKLLLFSRRFLRRLRLDQQYSRKNIDVSFHLESFSLFDHIQKLTHFIKGAE